MNRKMILFLISSFVWACSLFALEPVRLKDIARIEGVRENQLIGYGVVVGLNGTGDKGATIFSSKAISNMLKEMGISISPADIKMRNVAAVVVTAQIPPFVRPGTKIDCLVSSIGDATDLSNGVLLMTPLMGPDGKVYAVAQGPLSLGGYSAREGRTRTQKNHPTVGRIPDGAIVEREIPVEFVEENHISILLNQPDFTTAYRMVKAIEKSFGKIAQAVDASRVIVSIPKEFKQDVVGFISLLEQIRIEPDTKARVVINERTGTVVVGKDVKIDTVAISHGNLSVQIKSQWLVSQPMPLSGGSTEVVPQSGVRVVEQKGKMVVINATPTVGDLATALNALGVGPRDIISIFQAIKEAGALAAELIII